MGNVLCLGCVVCRVVLCGAAVLLYCGGVALPAGVFHNGEGQTEALGVSKRGGAHLDGGGGRSIPYTIYTLYSCCCPNHDP